MTPTHIATLYGVRCYYNDRTHELIGCTWGWELLLDLALVLHGALSWISPDYGDNGFPLVLVQELA